MEMDSEDRLFENLRDSGYSPDTVIDVGAYKGWWSKSIHGVFSDAEIIMIEAQEDKKEVLESLEAPNKEVYISVLSDVPNKTVQFYKGKTGSSYYPENTDFEMDITERQTERLDSLLEDEQLSNALLKLDVQGAELDVIEGATGILDSVSVIYIECSLIEYNDGAPLVEDVVNDLRERGFIPYSIGNKHHRGNQIIQIDILFVDDNSKLADEWQRNI